MRTTSRSLGGVVVVGRSKPQTRADRARLHALRKLGFPRRVLERLDGHGCAMKSRCEQPTERLGVELAREQRLEHDVRPQRRRARLGLEHGIVGRVSQRDRLGAREREQRLGRRHVGGGKPKRQSLPAHGTHFKPSRRSR